MLFVCISTFSIAFFHFVLSFLAIFFFSFLPFPLPDDTLPFLSAMTNVFANSKKLTAKVLDILHTLFFFLYISNRYPPLSPVNDGACVSKLGRGKNKTETKPLFLSAVFPGKATEILLCSAELQLNINT